MNLAKQSTAKTFLIGPILDADGVAKTDPAEVVASIKVTKNGTVGAVDAQDTLTHNHTGHYVFVSDGGDFDTLGEVIFSLNSGTNAMSPVRFQVVPANVYDSLVLGSDNLDANVTHLAGASYAVADTTGNWATNDTWAADSPPTAGQHVIVNHDVLVTVAADLDLGQFGTLTLIGSGSIQIAANKVVASVPAGWTIKYNYGTVTINSGRVTNNSGTVETNYSTGTVTYNYGGGTVTTNSGTVTTNYSSGTVTYNYGTVTYNIGTVTSNSGVILYGTDGIFPKAVAGAASGLALTADLAREAHRASGAIYHVKYAVAEDLTKDGLSWAAAKETAGPGVKTVIEAAAAGDTVLIGAGTFALGANYVQNPARVTVRGAGVDVTTITSTLLLANGTIWVPSDNGEVSDLTIKGALEGAANAYQGIFGGETGQPAWTNTIGRRLRLIGAADVLRITREEACSTIFEQCILESMFDNVLVSKALTKVLMIDCRISSRRFDTRLSGGSCNGLNVSNGRVELRNCDIYSSAKGSGVTAYGISCSGGEIDVQGGTILTEPDADGFHYSMRASGTGKIFASGVECDRSLSSTTQSGTITDYGTGKGVANIFAKLPSKSYLTGTNKDDGDVQLDEATGALSAAALAAAATAAIYPLTSVVNGGQIVETNWRIKQHSALKSAAGGALIWTITDQTGAAVNLAGKSLAMKLYPAGAPGTILVTYATGGTGLTLGGDENNVISLSADNTYTKQPRRLSYVIWNTTDSVPVAGGHITVEEEAAPT